MKQDIRLALRAIARSRSYTAMVIGSLAIGIAAPAIAFSIINAAIFRALDGVEDEDALVRIGLTGERGQCCLGSTYDLHTALRDGVRDHASLAAFIPADFAVSHDAADAVVLKGELVSANYFDTLQVRPAAGRFFTGDERVAPIRDAVVVIGYNVWRRQFQLSADVIGRYLNVNGTPLQIIGVAPERFEGVRAPDDQTRLWVPFGLAELALRRNGQPITLLQARRVDFGYIGRLKPGARLDQMEATAASIVYQRSGDGTRAASFDDPTRQLEAGTAPRSARVTRFWRMGLELSWSDAAEWFLALMALPLLVLAIACVNAANVVLARATRMTGVWTLQLALGASRSRLLRQPILEGLFLALIAAAAGLLLTRWGFLALQALLPFEPVVDQRVVVFAFGVAAATPLLFGVAPAWSVLSRVRRHTPGQHLQISPRSRVRTGLLIVQAALSLALLGTGSQFVRTVRDGFGDGLGRGDRMLVASVDVDKLRLAREETDAYYTTLIDRVRTVPGASQATLIGGINLFAGVPREGQTGVWLPEDPPDKPRASVIAYVTQDAFRAIGTPLVRGRTFTPEEHAEPLRAVIVNEPFAERVMGSDPLGRTIRVRPGDPNAAIRADARVFDVVVVGVVRAAQGRRNDASPTIYAPTPVVHVPARTLYIPFGDPAVLAGSVAAVRDAIGGVDPRVPHTIARLDDARWRRSSPRTFTAVAVAALGGLGLILAAVGLYGAVSYVVELRTREIGIRMALGATSSTVLQSVLGQAVITAATGCAIGTAGAAAVAAVMRGSLYGTGTIDPIMFAAAMGVLMMTMLLASAVPAARAARIDPAVTLRGE